MRFLCVSLLLPIVLGSAVPGQERCALGPPYWCSHVSHARECGATKHCLQTVWKYQIIKPKSTETCTYCELLVNELKDVLADKVTDDKIASVLANACAAFQDSDRRDMCKGIVEQYVPELLQMFQNDVSTDMICATVGFCSGLGDKWSQYGVKVNNNTYCADCTKFFKDVQAIVTSNETVNELEQLFNQTLCSQLGSFSGMCNNFLKQYLPIGLQALADQVDPDIVCRMFGMCTSSDKRIDVIKINTFYRDHKFKLRTGRVSTEECDICKDLFNQVDEFIRDKTNQDKVKYVLENDVCSKFGAYQDECKQLVEQYLPMLFELLENELDPTTVCESVGLCAVPSQPQAAVIKQQEPSALVGPGWVKDSLPCTLCKTVMTEIDQILQNNDTIIDVEDLIAKVCEKLPTGDLKNQCKAFVKEYGALVVDLLAQKLLDPKTFCTDIGLCKKSVAMAVKDDGKCQLCMLIVTEIQTLLANFSQDDLLSDLKGVCNFLPGNWSSTCLNYVNEYGSLVISLIKSNPRTLCVLAQACNASHVPYMTRPIPETLPLQKGPSEACEVCGTVIMFLKITLKDNATREEIEEAMEAVCQYLPSALSVPCEDFVEKYGDKIIELILKDINANQICAKLGLCTALKKTLSALSVIMSPYDTLPLVDLPETSKGKASAGNAVECEACKLFMSYLDKELQKNKTEENIKALLDKLCSEVPTALGGQCTTFVDEYTQDIINFLLLDLGPEAICEKLTLCPAGVRKLPEPVHVKLLKDVKEVAKDTAGPVCAVCEFVIKTLDEVLEGNKSEKVIKTALDTVCTYLPDTINKECVDFVNVYSAQIVDLLVRQIDPSKVCKLIRVCTSRAGAVKKQDKIIGDATKSTASPECVICEFVMKELDSILNDNSTEAEIEAALEKVCSILPSTLTEECDSFVTEYGDMIVKLLVQELDPTQICTALRLCSSQHYWGTFEKKIPEKSKDTTKSTADPECVLCEFIMTELDKLLKDNSTEAEIKAALEKVCSILPSTLTEECNSFVTEYEPLIIALLAQELDPTQICTLIGLCSSQQSWGTFVKILPEKSKDVECEMCKYLVEAAQKFLKENYTKDELEDLLKKVCAALPDTISEQCNDVINQYVPAILDLIDQNLKPAEICKKVEACNATVRHAKGDETLRFKPSTRLVGVNKCTYGPAYWCANKDNAKACNAMEHCMRHVWQN